MKPFSIRSRMGALAMVAVLTSIPFTLAADKAAYPAAVKKTLYAADFRGKAAPEFVVEKWLTSKPDTAGKVVIIDFWATWCGPCRATIPELNELQKKFKDDVVVIGISDEKEETVTNFSKTTPMDYSSAIDTKGTTKGKYKVEGIPHVVIISTDGVVRWQGFPLSDEEKLTADIVQKVIDADPGVAKRRADAAKPKG